MRREVDVGAAKEAADPFRALAETTPDAILTAAADNRIAFVNPAAERLLGYTADQLIGEPIGKIVPEQLRAVHDAGFARYVATREPRVVGSTVVVDVRRADGSTCPVELSLGAAGGAEDLTLTAVIRDISERVRHQRHVAAQLAVTAVLTGADDPDREQRLMQALVEGLEWDVGVLWLPGPDGRLRAVAVAEREPHVAEAFARYCRAMTFGSGEGVPGLVLQTAEPMWLEEAVQRIRFERTEVAAESGLKTGVALPLISQDMAIGVLEVFTAQAEALDEELRDMLSTVASQIAESLRRELQAIELARSNAELEQFASIAAHDLGEPLHTIAGFAQLLEIKGPQEPAEARDWIRTIGASAERGRRLLSALLSLARAGAHAPEPEAVDCNDLVHDVVASLGARITEEQATIEVGELPVVLADPVLLSQVFQNLLANAIKFRADQPPAVRITADRAGDRWTFSIADNGRGIPSGTNVFEMFSRAHKHDEAGAGIGLAVCRKIVEAHGGQIWFDTTPAGTTFHFTLPGTQRGALPLSFRADG
jgi:PAS domain S-box-containing protein